MNSSDLVNMRTIVGMFIIIRTIVRLIAKRVNTLYSGLSDPKSIEFNASFNSSHCNLKLVL